MTYTAQTPIRGTARGDPDRICTWAVARGAKRPADLLDYLRTVYALAPSLGLNADVVVAQSLHECTHRDTGEPWASVPWVHGLNPAGLGVTSDAQWRVYDFRTGERAAKAHLLHLSLYVNGDTVPDGFATGDDPRWQAAIDAGYAGIAATLDDLNGTWAIDAQRAYGEKIAARLNLMESAGLFAPSPRPIPAPPSPPEAPMPTHRYILSAGHRNTNKGGAHREIDWTYPSVVALKREIEKRGGKAWIVQEEDGDGDPTFYRNGGLQSAAAKCVALAKLYGPFDAYISSHYDSSPGFHAIFPDAPTGGVDVKANNSLDVRLCRAMRDRVKATGTVPMKSWTRDSPGVMSERETGVGSKGYRLGEFYGTLGFREETARVIIEASGTGDSYIWKAGWVEKTYAPAIVDALEDVFGKFRVDTPAPVPTPIPQPERADPIPELESLPAYLKLPNGAQLIRVDHTVQAVRDTPRLKWASPQSPKIGPDVKAGELFDVQYLVVNPDGGLWWYSAYATRFKFEDAVPYVGDVDGELPVETREAA